MERLADLTKALAPVGAQPRAVDFGRYVQTRIRGVSAGMENAEEFARVVGGSRIVEALRKSAIAAGTTSDSTWAGPLATANTLGAEFVALERAQSVLGRLAVRRVPFNCKFSRVDVATVAGWTAQGRFTPVARADLATVTLGITKIGGIAIVTRELADHSNPSAATAISQDLAASSAAFQDQQLLDPDVVAVSDTTPASITSGLSAITSAGSSLANVVADLKLAMGQIIASGHPLRRATWIMSEKTATYIATLQVTGGAFAFPTMGPNGGVLLGLPCITSGACEQPGSPSEAFIVLVDPQSIAVADDGGVDIDISREASVEMSDSPSVGATQQVSLWQRAPLG